MSKELSAETLALAAGKLGISEEETRKTGKNLPGTEAWYFHNPVRGGSSIIVDEDGTYLFATSLVNPKDHIQSFLDGKRSG